jgi:hypothetical protein
VKTDNSVLRAQKAESVLRLCRSRDYFGSLDEIQNMTIYMGDVFLIATLGDFSPALTPANATKKSTD